MNTFDRVWTGASCLNRDRLFQSELKRIGNLMGGGTGVDTSVPILSEGLLLLEAPLPESSGRGVSCEMCSSLYCYP